MEFYNLLKFVHISGAILWVGGGLTFTFLSLLAAGDRARTFALVRDISALGPRLFMPASLLVIVSGGTLVWLGAWSFDAWVVLALVAVAASFVLGATVVGPTADRATRAIAAGEDATAMDLIARLVRIGRLEQVLQVATVCLMVTKPGWADLPILAVVGLGTVLAMAAILAPMPRLPRAV